MHVLKSGKSQSTIPPEEICTQAVEDCEIVISAFQDIGRLGADDSDPLFKELSSSLHLLKLRLKWYRGCVDSSGPSSKGNIASKLVITKLRGLVRKGDDPVEMARKALLDSHDQLCQILNDLDRKTWDRKPHMPLGMYKTLGECKLLVSEHCERPWRLKGRYEELGTQLFELVRNLMSIEANLEERVVPAKPKTKYDDVTLELRYLHKALTFDCEEIISFILAVPYDLKAFEAAMMEMHRLVRILQSHTDDFESQRDLSALVDVASEPSNPISNVPEYPEVFNDVESSALENEAVVQHVVGSSSNLSNLFRCLKKTMEYRDLLRLDAVLIRMFVKARKLVYDEKQKAFVEPFLFASANEQSIPKFNLSAGDLSNTSKVVACMTRPRERKGLGLSSYDLGDKIDLKPRRGNYGDVYCMNIKDMKGSESSRLYAVKIMTASGENARSLKSNALANLRMLREAERWSAVSSDPNYLAEGGQYLAGVEGIWTGPEFGRPGLVSLWIEDNLPSYISGNALRVTEKLVLASKVAQGVKYLHSRVHPIVHGNLNAANILIHNGEPLLTDFGVAKCLDRSHGYTTGELCYSERYIAPELRDRERSLIPYPTRESDVFAFGCVLFEILSEKPPFFGLSPETADQLKAKGPDMTPIEYVEFLQEEGNRYQFDPEHTNPMNCCFEFHASKRPTMTTVVEALEKLQGPA